MGDIRFFSEKTFLGFVLTFAVAVMRAESKFHCIYQRVFSGEIQL